MARTLPHSLETEAAIIGCVLTDAACLRRLAHVEVEAFYGPRHQALWMAIGNLAATSQPIDPVTVEAELGRIGKLEAVGGMAAIGEIYIRHSAPSMVDAYAATLIEHWNGRRAIEATARVLDALWAGDDDGGVP